MRILHLSDTPLSGAPLRLHSLLNKYDAAESRYIMWQTRAGHRFYGEPTASAYSHREELEYLIYQWSDIIHFHNRWRRQEVFKALHLSPPRKPSIIHFHSPRASEDFSDELASGLPIVCPAQYHPRVFPEVSYILPNVVDIYDTAYIREYIPEGPLTVSYAPSNAHLPKNSWDDKGYWAVAPVLKRLHLKGEVNYQLIFKKPLDEVMQLKRLAHIGVDTVSNFCKSYHLSTLEYLSLGVPCITSYDDLIEKTVKDLTGCTTLPWVNASPDNFYKVLGGLIKNKENMICLSNDVRGWMTTYWNPSVLCKHYISMYKSLG